MVAQDLICVSFGVLGVKTFGNHWLTAPDVYARQKVWRSPKSLGIYLLSDLMKISACSVFCSGTLPLAVIVSQERKGFFCVIQVRFKMQSLSFFCCSLNVDISVMSMRSYVAVRQILYQLNVFFSYIIGPCGLATCMNEAIIWININYMQNSLMLWRLEHTVLQRQHMQSLERCDFGTALFQIGAFMVFMVDLLMMDDFSIWFKFYKWRGDDLFQVHPLLTQSFSLNSTRSAPWTALWVLRGCSEALQSSIKTILQVYDDNTLCPQKKNNTFC